MISSHEFTSANGHTRIPDDGFAELAAGVINGSVALHAQPNACVAQTSTLQTSTTELKPFSKTCKR